MFDDTIRLKLILLGDSGVGKSSILQRYYEDVFDSKIEVTNNAHFLEKEVTINEENVILEYSRTRRISFFNSNFC